MNSACDICGGACCETVESRLWPGDAHQNVLLKLRSVWHNKQKCELNAPCKHLASSGRCSIYEDRPKVCRDYEPGGHGCREIVKRLRHPQIAKVILARLDSQV